MSNPWKIKFSRSIQQRNDQEAKPFSQLINQYENICNEFRKSIKSHHLTREKLNSLQTEHDYYKQELSKLQHSSSLNNLQSSTSTPSTPTSSSISYEKRIKELEEKVFTLQEELTAAFRAKAESAQTLLDLNTEIKRLKTNEQEQKLNLEKILIELENLKEKNKQNEELLLKKETTIEVLKKEREALQLDIEERDKRINQFTEENRQMLNHVVEQKQKQVDAMNQVNELYKTVMQQKQQLQMLQAKYRGGSNSSMDGSVDNLNISVNSPNNIGGNNSGGNNSASTPQAEEKKDGGFFSFFDKIRNNVTQLTNNGTNVNNNNGMMMTSSPIPKDNENKEKITILPPMNVVQKQTIETQINGIDFSEDGFTVGIACGDKTIRVYNSKSGQSITTLHGSTDSVIKVKFSSSGNLALGACSDSICRIWNLSNDRVRHTLTGHTKKIYGAAFSSDVKRVVTGAHDRTIKIWELQFGTCEKTLLTCKSSVNDLEISRGGDVISSAHFDSCVRLWDMRTFKLISEIDKAHGGQQVTSVAFSNDCTKLLSNGRDNLIKIYDLRMSYKVMDTLKHAEYKNLVNYNKACFSPCGEYVAAGSANGKLLIWALTPSTTKAMGSSVVINEKAHSNSVSGVVWNPDGSQIASCGYDKQLLIYE
ncbi:hypothetical protein ABK040_015470 [Willaertia magna]